jgi:hypothetical protein
MADAIARSRPIVMHTRANEVRDSAHLHALQVGERSGRSIAATSDWAP